MDSDRPPQFSMRQMFLATLFAAVLFTALFALPDAWAGAVLMTLSMMLTVVIALLIIHGRGRTRVFWIGAMFSVLPVAITTGLFFVLAPFEAGDNVSISEWLLGSGWYSLARSPIHCGCPYPLVW